MADDTGAAIQSSDKCNKNEWANLWRNLILSVVPLFFGSLLFSGLIELYKDDISSKRLILTDQFRPMREIAVNCHNLHNRLSNEYINLSGSFALSFNELNRVVNRGNSLGPDYAKIADAVLSTRSESEKLVKQLDGDVNACYSKLWRQYEEVAIVTASYEDFLKISSHHIDNMNAILRKSGDEIRQISGDTDLLKVWNGFVELAAAKNRNAEQAQHYIEANPRLFSIATEFNAHMSRREAELLSERDAVSNEAGSLFAKKINELFAEGFFHRLFRLI
ncbi:MAG: hypothetical protein EPN26_02705 [Rhodospirillales bacterium]|nr:MAG: hypothetical protein EPN26_02705 [Rhodospirillales bacterium]